MGAGRELTLSHRVSAALRATVVALILWEMKGSRVSPHSPLYSQDFIVSIPYGQTETQRSAGAHGFPDGFP